MCKKFINFIFKLLYIFLIIYLLIFVPRLWGWNPLVVVSDSMNPTLKVGGILYYHETEIEDFKNGDILVYQIPEHIISHRIINNNGTEFVTKGDANNNVDSNPVNYNQVIGKGTNWCIPLLGYYANFIYTHKYLLFISIAIIGFDLFSDVYKEHKKKVEKNDKKIE